MMNLLRENAENKKRMALSVICGCVTVIAVCALVALASFLEVAAGWRVALLALAGGGAFAYVKFIKPKQGMKVSTDPDDYDFEDEEMVNEDDIV